MTSLALRLLDLAVAAFALVYLVRPQDFLRSGPADAERPSDRPPGSGRPGEQSPGAGGPHLSGPGPSGENGAEESPPTVGFVDRSVLFGGDESPPSPFEPGRLLGLLVVVVGLALAFGVV